MISLHMQVWGWMVSMRQLENCGGEEPLQGTNTPVPPLIRRLALTAMQIHRIHRASASRITAATPVKLRSSSRRARLTPTDGQHHTFPCPWVCSIRSVGDGK